MYAAGWSAARDRGAEGGFGGGVDSGTLGDLVSGLYEQQLTTFDCLNLRGGRARVCAQDQDKPACWVSRE